MSKVETGLSTVGPLILPTSGVTRKCGKRVRAIVKLIAFQNCLFSTWGESCNKLILNPGQLFHLPFCEDEIFNSVILFSIQQELFSTGPNVHSPCPITFSCTCSHAISSHLFTTRSRLPYISHVNSLGSIAHKCAELASFHTMASHFTVTDGLRLSTAPGDFSVVPLCITTEVRAPSIWAGSCYGQKQVCHCKSIER